MQRQRGEGGVLKNLGVILLSNIYLLGYTTLLQLPESPQILHPPAEAPVDKDGVWWHI